VIEAGIDREQSGIFVVGEPAHQAPRPASHEQHSPQQPCPSLPARSSRCSSSSLGHRRDRLLPAVAKVVSQAEADLEHGADGFDAEPVSRPANAPCYLTVGSVTA
jgi:hypothetical protein